ncbi:uncharacterized protein [Medicago truncatula]|uniref:Large ribosomal subunit protein uL23m n=1 Tax=Medicago truncatula TaxID=3880 RepID=G7J3R6_MEDTR|nr:uncharacterized protein LOC11415029 [Medicago truncatula]AES72201.2 50S ribosomal protein L23 [Medicago truncatula]
MGSRLGRRVVYFANLPIKLLLPTNFTDIHEIALKTIPSASKIEIKRVLESLYGFDVEKVRTLNMDGKKKKRGGIVIAKPDYKKAFVTLKTPLLINPNLFPIREIEEDKKSLNKQAMAASIVEEAPGKSHWLDENKNTRGFKPQNGYHRGGFNRSGSNLFESSGSNQGRFDRSGSSRGRFERPGSNRADGSAAKFPWSNMRTGRSNATR